MENNNHQGKQDEMALDSMYEYKQELKASSHLLKSRTSMMLMRLPRSESPRVRGSEGPRGP